MVSMHAKAPNESGNTTLRWRTEAWRAEEQRNSVMNTMVCINKDSGATPRPMQVRGKLE